MLTLNVLETKITVFFMLPASWSTDISSFYYSDINLFLIDYTCCKLCNIWLLLFENNSRSYYYIGALHWRKNIVVVVTQDRVIDDNWAIPEKARQGRELKTYFFETPLEFLGFLLYPWKFQTKQGLTFLM